MNITITIGDAAEALYQLRREEGLYYNPTKQQIIEKAIQLKSKRNYD